MPAALDKIEDSNWLLKGVGSEEARDTPEKKVLREQSAEQSMSHVRMETSLETVGDRRTLDAMRSMSGASIREMPPSFASGEQLLTPQEEQMARSVRSIQEVMQSAPFASPGESLTERLARQHNVSPDNIVAANPEAPTTVSDATNGKPNAAKQAQVRAERLIDQRIQTTRQQLESVRSDSGSAVVTPSQREDIKIGGILDGETWSKIGNALGNLLPGDRNQKIVSDLGIEPVPTVDLKSSTGITAKADLALAEANTDPKHFNCNDYVRAFVLSQQSEKDLQDHVKGLNHPPLTGSPEGFLRKNGYEPISALPLKEGDVIVVHSPDGQHSAVIAKDPSTGELSTMQKPNPTEMPVRLTLDQFCRAEHVSMASVEVYRKK